MIPESIFSLDNLRSIDFTFHDFEEIPDYFANSKSLIELDITFADKLKRVPAKLVEDSNLQQLNFRQCDFPSIPAGLEHPKSLKKLTFWSCNKIKDALENLPPEMARITTI